MEIYQSGTLRKRTQTRWLIHHCFFHPIFIGVLFGYYVVLPLSINFFGTFNVSSTVINQFTVDSYVSMVKTSLVGSGLVFEMPIIIYFLAKLGLVTPEF